MNNLYIINPENFNGSVLNTMPFVTPEKINESLIEYNVDFSHIENGKTVYENTTFAQYNARYGGKLIAIPWPQFKDEFYSPFLKSLQKPFEEITEDKFMFLLECVPPKKWHDINKTLNMFFVGECDTANLYTCCIFDKKAKKYYSALRPINSKDEDLINDFNTAKV